MTPLPRALLSRSLESPVLAALAYPHAVDRYLELINPMWSVDAVRARVRQVERLTPGSCTVTLQPNRNWRGFEPGQFVQLTLEIDGVRRTRCYSPANSIHREDGCIELTAKAQPGGLVSNRLALLAVGDVVTLSQAAGAFALPAQRPRRLLLISGGSGITPVMSMLRSLRDENHHGRITFLHYAEDAESLIYDGELEALARDWNALDLIRVLRKGDGKEARGLFSAAQLEQLVPDFRSADTYLCGPPALMTLVEQCYAAANCTERLHSERFTPAPVPATAPAAAARIRFQHSGKTVANDGRSLLEQAEAAGLQPQSGCRMGICSTCSCRKRSGAVKNLISGEISTEADQDIRICVSVPVGDVDLDI